MPVLPACGSFIRDDVGVDAVSPLGAIRSKAENRDASGTTAQLITMTPGIGIGNRKAILQRQLSEVPGPAAFIEEEQPGCSADSRHVGIGPLLRIFAATSRL